jgi:hypothetical protein
VVKVDGLSAPLLLEGSIGDVEDALAALGKVGIATRQHVIDIHARAGLADDEIAAYRNMD